jgi:hypothetical protein
MHVANTLTRPSLTSALKNFGLSEYIEIEYAKVATSDDPTASVWKKSGVMVEYSFIVHTYQSEHHSPVPKLTYVSDVH